MLDSVITIHDSRTDDVQMLPWSNTNGNHGDRAAVPTRRANEERLNRHLAAESDIRVRACISIEHNQQIRWSDKRCRQSYNTWEVYAMASGQYASGTFVNNVRPNVEEDHNVDDEPRTQQPKTRSTKVRHETMTVDHDNDTYEVANEFQNQKNDATTKAGATQLTTKGWQMGHTATRHTKVGVHDMKTTETGHKRNLQNTQRDNFGNTGEGQRSTVRRA